MRLSQKFKQVKDAINGEVTNFEGLRDQVVILADLCEDLALKLEETEAAANRASYLASQLANGSKPD